MLKKTLTYEDFDGNQRTEDFYFNLTKAEIMEMEMSATGGLEKMINRIIATQDSKEIISIFKDLVIRAYGEKSLDGKNFVKTQEVKDKFLSSQAYSDIFMELATNEEEAAKFFNGIIPKDMQEAVKKAAPQLTTVK